MRALTTVLALFLTLTMSSQSIIGIGATGVYTDPIQGTSFAYNTRNFYFGINLNKNWNNTDKNHKEFLVGVNTRKVKYEEKYNVKFIPSFEVYATFYAGWHQINSHTDNLAMGTRLNIIFKKSPLGFYVDSSKDGRLAYGVLIIL